MHDAFQAQVVWPADMDGRAIIGESYKDYLSGLPIEKNVAKYKHAKEIGDTSRSNVWAYVLDHT